MRRASQFCSRCSTELVPGIGSTALDLGGVFTHERVVHREREPRRALARAETRRLEVQTAAHTHSVGRSRDELRSEPGSLEREGRVNPEVAVDLPGLLELERARDMSALPATVPPVEGALVHGHDSEVLGIRDPRAILALDPEHARHRGSVGLPEPDPPVIVGREHDHSVGQWRKCAWAILAATGPSKGTRTSRSAYRNREVPVEDDRRVHPRRTRSE
jgi:hypothetical protein